MCVVIGFIINNKQLDAWTTFIELHSTLSCKTTLNTIKIYSRNNARG